MSELDRITMRPEQCGGRPCIRGLRVRVKDILDLLASGASREEILADYPYLESEDITAALEFAVKQTDHRELALARSPDSRGYTADEERQVAMIEIAAEPVPLEMDAHGTLRVGGPG